MKFWRWCTCGYAVTCNNREAIDRDFLNHDVYKTYPGPHSPCDRKTAAAARRRISRQEKTGRKYASDFEV